MRTWKAWKETHQPFELSYHINEGIGWCEDEAQFHGFWDAIFDFIGVKGEKLDIGCGPRPPFGEGIAVDPLADSYRKLRPQWWEGITAYSQPAEEFIPELEGKFQTVLCWNCLDHTIGWKQILLNLKSYGAKDAVYAIATDFKPPHIGHPGFDRAEFFTELEKHFEVTKYAEDFQERDVALVLGTL
jgi:hypothetical protein